MNIAGTQCLILKTADYGESDKLVTAYTWDNGKITGIAKGAKRSQKRFVNKLEPFSKLEISYKAPRTGGLLLLVDAQLSDAFLSLRTDYKRYVAATYLGELILLFTRQKDTDHGLYELLDWALRAVDQGERPLKVLALFHIRLLDIAGYQPQVDYCGICGTSPTPKNSYSLLAGSGLLVCNRCRSKQGQKLISQGISMQTLSFLRSSMQVDLDRLLRLQLSDHNAAQILRALFQYSRHLLQQDIHTWKAVVSTLFTR